MADDSNDRLQEFTPEGAFVGAYGTSGAGNGQFNAPTAVSFDCHGNAYVADYGNNRIQRFGDPGAGAGACTPPILTSTAPTNVDATSATLTASVNPNGTLAIGRFDFGPSTAYDSRTADQNFGFDTVASTQSAKAAGLAPGRTYHYRVAGSGAFGAASSADRAFTTLNRIDSFAISRNKFAVGSGRTALVAKKRVKRAKKGTTFSYVLAAAGSASIRIDQLVKARRSKGKCRKKAKKGKRCTLTVKKGTLKRSAKAAQNKVKFSGRLGRKKLGPGRYTATITATAPGTTTPSKAKTLSFKIVRR